MPKPKDYSENSKLIYIALVTIKKYLLQEHHDRAQELIDAIVYDLYANKIDIDGIHLVNYLIPEAFSENSNHQSPVTNHGDCKEQK